MEKPKIASRQQQQQNYNSSAFLPSQSLTKTLLYTSPSYTDNVFHPLPPCLHSLSGGVFLTLDWSQWQRVSRILSEALATTSPTEGGNEPACPTSGLRETRKEGRKRKDKQDERRERGEDETERREGMERGKGRRKGKKMKEEKERNEAR